MKAIFYGILWLCLTFLCTCGPAQNSQVVTAEGSSEANLSSSQIIQPEKVTVMEGLRRPWSMTFLNEDEALLNEKDGNLLRVNLATGAKTIIAGLPADLADSLTIDSTQFPPVYAFPSAHGKRLKYNAGLFDIKLDPDFTTNRWVYLAYAAQESETVKSLEELLVDDRSRTRKVVVSPGGKIYLLTDEDNGKIIRVRNSVTPSQSIGYYLEEQYRAGELNGNVLIVQNDKTVYEASFGYADPEKQNVLTAEHRFGFGSIYKEFPALAVMQLREQGKLTLEDRLIDHLPDLPPWATQIRLKHLLRYTAGLPPVDWGSYFAKGEIVTTETLWRALRSLPELAFEPGTDYLYGNYPPMLLIALVEKLTNTPFHHYATDNLFRPAGMKNITLANVFPYANNDLMAIPFNQEGEPDDYRLADFHLLYCATTQDIAAWVRALHAEKLLPQNELKLLVPTHDPSDENQQSALGNCTISQGKIAQHMHHGSMGNYEGLFLHDRAEDLTIVLLTNQKHFNVHELVETIHAMILDK